MTLLHVWLIQALATTALIVALFVIGGLSAWFARPLPAQPKEWIAERHLYHLERRELL